MVSTATASMAGSVGVGSEVRGDPLAAGDDPLHRAKQARLDLTNSFRRGQGIGFAVVGHRLPASLGVADKIDRSGLPTLIPGEVSSFSSNEPELLSA